LVASRDKYGNVVPWFASSWPDGTPRISRCHGIGWPAAWSVLGEAHVVQQETMQHRIVNYLHEQEEPVGFGEIAEELALSRLSQREDDPARRRIRDEAKRRMK
jgi:hypothetical protein